MCFALLSINGAAWRSSFELCESQIAGSAVEHWMETSNLPFSVLTLDERRQKQKLRGHKLVLNYFNRQATLLEIEQRSEVFSGKG